MKKYLLLVVLVLVLWSCNGKVEVSVFNNSDVDRVNETVELCLCELTGFDATKLVVLNAEGNQVPSQILYRGTEKPQSLIFQVTLAAGKEETFTLKEGTRELFTAKTFAHFVPKRKDDFSWENDRIAFRMYGPKLAPENPSNGPDVWYKRTEALITDKWYNDDLSGKQSYHEDHGEGLDCYKVAHTLGAGGICPYSNDSLWIGRYFDRYQILDNGPLRSSFVLFYDAIPYQGKTLKAEYVVSLDAGSNLNEVRVRYTGDTTEIRLAAGMWLHDSIQSLSVNQNLATIGYAEDLMSEGKKPVPAGRGYTGVVFPGSWKESKKISGHMVGIFNYKIGEEFQYFFGAGWNKHGFASDKDWFNYLNSKKAALLQPLKIKILK
jgi:hypothetical protein